MSEDALLTSAPSNANKESVGPLPPPRQIRFVSTDGRPHIKRRRISTACLTCRKRKIRCSGERPECKTCTDNAHCCSGYSDEPFRRSINNSKDSDEHEDSSSPVPRKDHHLTTEDGLLQASNGLSPTSWLTQQNSGGSASSSSPTRSKHVPGDTRSPGSIQTVPNTASSRNRVPYFRYFGPTAIVPGFKQMVVQMKDQSLNSISADSPSSAATGATPSVAGLDRPRIFDIPFYDATDPTPNAPLITELCEIFFTHLGCNYPFLQRERFLQDLESKRVDAILVDAVCAVAARFSAHPLLSGTTDQSIQTEDYVVKKAFRGHPFAQRAMASVINTFSCPTIAVSQACLLLAYEEFGTDHDSGLWMYLGTSIRMAQDLGIQKLEGLQLEGRIGPTPKTAKHGVAGKEEEKRRFLQQESLTEMHKSTDAALVENRRASEQERIDTFYAIYFLDRAVSSGVGRPVTLRDKDIEVSFPYRSAEHAIDGWPHPFPPMIRIVHMYGRVADVLNSIKEINQVTPDVLQRLAAMEKDLTEIYQALSPKLHFNATNFQHYVKAEQGTNFILLHFWFHTLIVLLHQPTLLHSFEGRIQQLFPDSRELSMSSAKTIADILAFAELIDVKSFIGNPFTSQPIYIAACAFLAEATAHASQPPSGDTTPSKAPKYFLTQEVQPHFDRRYTAKHTLLATAANQNYQRCYKALKLLGSYWAGCRYILTALDQKSKGLMDPLLFTSDDLDGEMPSTEPSFTTPGWRRSSSNTVSMSGSLSISTLSKLRAMQRSSPKIDHNGAIGWSLAGTTNSPAPNLSFLYQSQNAHRGERGRMSPKMDEQSQSAKPRSASRRNQPSATSVTAADRNWPAPTYPGVEQGREYQSQARMMPPPVPFSSVLTDPVSAAEADLLLGLHSPYATNNHQSPNPAAANTYPAQPPMLQSSAPQSQTFDFSHRSPSMFNYLDHVSHSEPARTATSGRYPSDSFGDMLIESQDIDMSGPQGGFAFPGGDMIPWLEYLPQDVLNYFGEPHEDLSMMMPSGPGPPGEGQ